MSARRERVPLTGRSNLDAVPKQNPGSARPGTANPTSARRHVPFSNNQESSAHQTAVSSRLAESGHQMISSRSGNVNIQSARSEASDISVGEVLRRMRMKSDISKDAIDTREIAALGDYNAFSRPRPSKDIPLRSVLLDPKINNFPKSRTRTELMQKIRVTSAPHPSYDLDMDGYVSQEDYRLAKRFDFDGNGVLDPEERAIGKRVLADEFFKEHEKAGDLSCFGNQFGNKTHNENVTALANAYSFERAYDRLLSVERTLKAGSSETILSCMRTGDDTLTRHNYYSNKFDCTAWNDFDAIPRSASTFGLHDHGGSRKRLMFTRKQAVLTTNEQKMTEAQNKVKMPNTRRMALITNVAMENT